ncbi:MAG: hypothetical protein AB8C46_12950 [Burkholderiaceae bacterium]
MRYQVPIIFIAVLLSACDKTPVGDEMFPLEKGRSWTYQVTTNYQGQAPIESELNIKALGSDTIDGQTVWRRYSDTGSEYWLRPDETGIIRVASKHGLDNKAVVDKPSRYVLKKPFAIDSSWSAPTTAYLLERYNQKPKRVSETHGFFPMEYRIDAVDIDVATQAGKFSACLLVLGRAAIRLYVDAALAWRNVPLTTREWYCPQVGLVKLEREEPTPSRFMKGGKYTLELIAWE